MKTEVCGHLVKFKPAVERSGTRTKCNVTYSTRHEKLSVCTSNTCPKLAIYHFKGKGHLT